MRINKYWIKDIYVYILVKELIELYKPFNQYWTKVGFYLQITAYTWAPHVIPLFSLFSFSFLHPIPLLSFPCFRQERRENERVRERESHRPGNHFARNSGNRKRNSNLAPSPVWLVNPLSISLSFRVFVFLGFRWKPVELHQIDCTMPLLFLKCLFVDFVFQFVTKLPTYGLPEIDLSFGTVLSNWPKSDSNCTLGCIGALVTWLISTEPDLRLYVT